MFEVMQAQAGTVSHFDYNSRELVLSTSLSLSCFQDAVISSDLHSPTTAIDF